VFFINKFFDSAKTCNFEIRKKIRRDSGLVDDLAHVENYLA
jgi:hypothetical protein